MGGSYWKAAAANMQLVVVIRSIYMLRAWSEFKQSSTSAARAGSPGSISWCHKQRLYVRGPHTCHTASTDTVMMACSQCNPVHRPPAPFCSAPGVSSHCDCPRAMPACSQQEHSPSTLPALSSTVHGKHACKLSMACRTGAPQSGAATRTAQIQSTDPELVHSQSTLPHGGSRLYCSALGLPWTHHCKAESAPTLEPGARTGSCSTHRCYPSATACRMGLVWVGARHTRSR